MVRVDHQIHEGLGRGIQRGAVQSLSGEMQVPHDQHLSSPPFVSGRQLPFRVEFFSLNGFFEAAGLDEDDPYDDGDGDESGGGTTKKVCRWGVRGSVDGVLKSVIEYVRGRW